MREIGNVFAARFSEDSFLDIVFISAEQEVSLREVCLPFFGNNTVTINAIGSDTTELNQKHSWSYTVAVVFSALMIVGVIALVMMMLG